MEPGPLGLTANLGGGKQDRYWLTNYHCRCFHGKSRTHTTHEAESLSGVDPFSGLDGQNETVCTVQHRVGDVGSLGPSRSGFVVHGVKQLSRHKDRFSGDVAVSDYVLLQLEYPLWRELDG